MSEAVQRSISKQSIRHLLAGGFIGATPYGSGAPGAGGKAAAGIW